MLACVCAHGLAWTEAILGSEAAMVAVAVLVGLIGHAGRNIVCVIAQHYNFILILIR
jgi:hypothetical protein